MVKNQETLIKITAFTAIAITTILVTIKSIAYLFTGSLALLASLIDSLLDLIVSSINSFACFYALKPKDDDHRFGHTAIEDIVGLAQSVFIAGSGMFIMIHALKSLIEKEIPNHDNIGISAMIISLFLTIFLVALQRYTLRKTKSLVIKADSMHYESDIFLNVAILGSFLIIKYTGFGYFDSIIAICVSIYMFVVSLKLGKTTFDNLMGKELPESIKKVIIDVINSSPKIKGYHDLKTRVSGRMKFMQFHIELEKTISLQEAHDITEEIEKKIMSQIENSEVFIHQDPR